MISDGKKELFETMPVPKAIAALAVPTVVSQLVNLVYNIVDTFYIGRTGNPSMVAAVTVAFTLFMLTIAFSNLFGVGGGGLVSRLIGKGLHGEAKKISAYSFWGAAAVAAGYSLLVAVFMDPLLYLFGASDDTIVFARQYVWLVVSAGSVPVILSQVTAFLLRNTGYSKQASLGLSGGGILNIILDPLFMFVLMPDGCEVLGAALATLLSNIVSCAFLLIVAVKVSDRAGISIDPREIRGVRRGDLRELYSVGVPSAVLTGLFDAANIVLNILMSAHGDLEVAAVGIVMKAERLPNAINLGICQGMLPIVAYNYSSGSRKRMSDVVKTVRLYGLLIAGVSLVLYELFTEPIIRVFLSTSAGNVAESLTTIGFAVTFLRFRSLGSPVQFLNYHSSYCMQAMGDGRGTLIHALLREIVFYIPCMILFDRLFGTTGLVLALPIGESFGALAAVFMLRKLVKKRQSEAALES